MSRRILRGCVDVIQAPGVWCRQAGPCLLGVFRSFQARCFSVFYVCFGLSSCDLRCRVCVFVSCECACLTYIHTPWVSAVFLDVCRKNRLSVVTKNTYWNGVEMVVLLVVGRNFNRASPRNES